MNLLKSFLLSAFCFLLLPAWAADRITVSVTVTNATTNGMSFTLNSNTRTFTNTVYNAATQVLTNSTATGTKTNLLSQIRSTAFAQVQSSDAGATNLNLVGNTGLAMSATISGDWGYVTYTTQTVAQMTAVRVPVSGEVTAVQTNIASGLIAALNLSANTNELNQTSKAATQLLGTTNTQTVTGAKTFSSTSGVWNGTITNSPGITGTLGAISNGIWWNGVLRGPSMTNGANYGNPFTSWGSGADSLQLAEGANAAGVSSISIGHLSAAEGDQSVALGYNAIAEGTLNTSLGYQADTPNDAPGSTAIGANSVVMSGHTNATVIGSSASSSAKEQVTLGSSAQHVSIPGGLYVAGPITNANIIGTNTINGHTKWIRKANSALANGANAAVDISTNSFVEVSGPTAAFSIAGIANGTDGRVLILLNQTGYVMTILHDSGLDSTAANRIYTGSSADVVLSGRSTAYFIYNAATSRWMLGPNHSGYTGLGSAALNGNTNMTVATSSSTNDVAGYTYSYNTGTVGVYTNDTFWVTNAGNYEISFGAGLLATASDVLKLMLYTNDVHCGVVQLQVTMAATPITETGFKRTLLPLPANCRVRLRVANDSAANTTVSDASFSLHGVD